MAAAVEFGVCGYLCGTFEVAVCAIRVLLSRFEALLGDLYRMKNDKRRYWNHGHCVCKVLYVNPLADPIFVTYF